LGVLHSFYLHIFFTLEITKKRFASLVAFFILIQSHVFLAYDTTATYENFWTLFYLLSLYAIYKFWPLSPVLFILSIFAKALSAAFFPMTALFIYRAKISRKKRIWLGIIYLVFFLGGIAALVIFDIQLAPGLGPDLFSNLFFWQGFSSMAFQLRFDVIVIFFLLPLIVGLFMAYRRGIAHAETIMFMIAWIIFTAPLLTGFTELTNQPYRYVPLVFFFAVGVGTILSKRSTN